MALLLIVAAVSWIGCSALAAYAHHCMRRAEGAVPWAEAAAERAEAAAVAAKHAATNASGFRRTRGGLR